MLRERYSVQLLCNTLGCSRSGYYDWIKLGRPQHKAFDQVINDLVMEMYNKDNRWGIRQIRMQIKTAYGLCLTNKTVYRYMRINGVQSIIRRKTHTMIFRIFYIEILTQTHQIRNGLLIFHIYSAKMDYHIFVQSKICMTNQLLHGLYQDLLTIS